mmetsp:Transcript_39816/g.94443  ORF Transcript_39816/g.94443 Transcript_39816/m.94443 type:complete len:236 (-) Transcript_39816:294-1001(-)
MARLGLGNFCVLELRGDFAHGGDEAVCDFGPDLLLTRLLFHRNWRVGEACHVHLALGPRVHFWVAKALEEDSLRQRALILHEDAVILLAVHRREVKSLRSLRTPRTHCYNNLVGFDRLSPHRHTSRSLLPLHTLNHNALHASYFHRTSSLLCRSHKRLCQLPRVHLRNRLLRPHHALALRAQIHPLDVGQFLGCWLPTGVHRNGRAGQSSIAVQPKRVCQLLVELETLSRQWPDG